MPVALAERYAELCATPSDVYEHLPTFVRVAQELAAKQVIELGTRSGVSTVAWLHAMELTGGHLWSVDVDVAPFDPWDYERWTFVHGDDCSETVFKALPDKVDVVFIDTSHQYEHTYSELSLYHWLVRPGGKILLHDTELAYPENVSGKPFPVRRAVEDFCTAEGFDWSIDRRCWGLATIEVS